MGLAFGFHKNQNTKTKTTIVFLFSNSYAVAFERLPYFLKNGNYIERFYDKIQKKA